MGTLKVIWQVALLPGTFEGGLLRGSTGSLQFVIDAYDGTEALVAATPSYGTLSSITCVCVEDRGARRVSGGG